MTNFENRPHGYWKIWGHAGTCSNCGYCEEYSANAYCRMCGAIMDAGDSWECPDISMTLYIPHYKRCAVCDYDRIIIGRDRYCPRCGNSTDLYKVVRINMEDLK